jgi:hypothetical protein
MRSDPEFQLFLKKWRDAFRAPSDLWDGNRAVAELKSARYTRSSPQENARRSMLEFVQCEPGYGPRPWDMLKGIVGEVKDYKSQKLAWKKERRDTEVFLAGVGRTVNLRASKVADQTLKSLLAAVAEMIEQQRRALRNSIRPAQQSPLGAWERIWASLQRRTDINRGIDLDTRLQIQSAKMLRTFLHRDDGISRRTIARLVLLVYVAAGLAYEKDGFLRIVDSPRALSLRGIEEKLEGIQID